MTVEGLACILEQETYKPGDLPPEGYLQWHEWAEAQRKAARQQGKAIAEALAPNA